MVHIGTGTVTDNTDIADKVHLRNMFLPDKEVISVLDAFTSNGLIWNALAKMNPGRTFEIARIDREKNKKGFYVRGENMRFLRSTDLNVYDVIDLDHYGVPFYQLEILFGCEFTSPVSVFVTINLVGIKPLHIAMLMLIGYSRKIIDTSRYLCSKNTEQKILAYLNFRGVSEVNKISFENSTGYHCYIHFILGEENGSDLQSERESQRV